MQCKKAQMSSSGGRLARNSTASPPDQDIPQLSCARLSAIRHRASFPKHSRYRRACAHSSAGNSPLNRVLSPVVWFLDVTLKGWDIDGSTIVPSSLTTTIPQAPTPRRLPSKHTPHLRHSPATPPLPHPVRQHSPPDTASRPRATPESRGVRPGHHRLQLHSRHHPTEPRLAPCFPGPNDDTPRSLRRAITPRHPDPTTHRSSPTPRRHIPAATEPTTRPNQSSNAVHRPRNGSPLSSPEDTHPSPRDIAPSTSRTRRVTLNTAPRLPFRARHAPGTTARCRCGTSVALREAVTRGRERGRHSLIQ